MPLYTQADAEAEMARVRSLPYDQREQVLSGIKIAFREAGHILGSASVEIYADSRKLVFSGDLGPKGPPILRDPARIDSADLVPMEFTCGDRLHRDRVETIRELGRILDETWRDKPNPSPGRRR